MNKPRICHVYSYLKYRLEIFTKFGVLLTYECCCSELNYCIQTYSIEDAEGMFRDYVDKL